MQSAMDIAGDIPDIQISPDQNGCEQLPDDDLNISDVIEAIGIASFSDVNAAMSWPWYVEITEQPAPKGLRFRYECEGRSAGSLLGVNSKPENKTYPTIKIHGYVGQATIIATCITKDDLLVHPHNLVGRNCSHGVCSVRVKITDGAREYQFKNLGIQCVKKKDIPAALANREQRRIDPFQKGFAHASDTSKIDLNAVRLAIQVIVKDAEGRDVSLHPVFTEIIYDKKSSSDLLIMRASHCSGVATGGTKLILLTERLVSVNRDDIVIAFYEEVDNKEVWCKEVTPSIIHRQYAIVLDTPPYSNPYTESHVSVYFQLRRRSDRKCSNSFAFEYIPADPFKVYKRKTPKTSAIAMYETESASALESKPVVKLEPRVTSPHMQGYQFGEQSPTAQRWESGAGAGAGAAGPSRGVQVFGQELPWQYLPPHAARHLPAHSPAMPAPGQHSPASSMAGQLSPSPGIPQMTPHSPHSIGQLSPHPGQAMGQLSPHPGQAMGQLSPHPGQTMGQLSPLPGQPMGHISPHSPVMGHISPHSPGMGQVSPHPGQMSHMAMGQDVQLGTSPGYMQQQQSYQMVAPPAMEQGQTLSEILNEQAGAFAQYDGDLFNELNNYTRDNDMSDSLNRLSTSDILFTKLDGQ